MYIGAPEIHAAHEEGSAAERGGCRRRTKPDTFNVSITRYFDHGSGALQKTGYYLKMNRGTYLKMSRDFSMASLTWVRRPSFIRSSQVPPNLEGTNDDPVGRAITGEKRC